MMNDAERETCEEAVSILRNMDGIGVAHQTTRQNCATAIETQYLIGATEHDAACVSLCLSIVYAEKCRVAKLEAQIDGCSCTDLPDGRGITCTMCAAKAAAEEMPF